MKYICSTPCSQVDYNNLPRCVFTEKEIEEKAKQGFCLCPVDNQVNLREEEQ